MDAIRNEVPNTIVLLTADNGAWLDAYPDAGTTPFRGEKGTPFEGGWRCPGVLWWPDHIPAGAEYGEMMSHIDCWATLAAMVGLTPPPHDWVGNDGKGIYFDSIDNSTYILGKAPHSARNSWVYIDGEVFRGVRADIGGDAQEPWLHIAWKYLYTAKHSWLWGDGGPRLNRCDLQPDHGSVRKVRHDVQRRGAGADVDIVAWAILGRGRRLGVVAARTGHRRFRQVDHEIPEYPAIRGRASNDLVPKLQHPDDSVPLLKSQLNNLHVQGGGG